MVAIRSTVAVASFLVLVGTIISPPCHGFSAFSPASSVTKYSVKNNASNELPTRKRRTFLSSFSDSKIEEDYKNNSNKSNWTKEGSSALSGFKRIATSVSAAILSVMLCTGDVIPLQGGPESLFSLGRPQVCQAMTPDQLLVDDVWREVERQFFDSTFNGQGEEGWKKKRLMALEKAAYFGPDDDAKLYAVIRGMLQSLNDPYTRFLTPDQFESMTKMYASNPNSPAAKPSSGIGIQLIGDNRASTSESGPGLVVVVNTLAKSGAEAAGILPGDYIRSVDGVDMVGATAEAVAAKCRGETGTTVSIDIERPPAEGAPSALLQKKTIVVTRSPITPTPMIEASTAVVAPAKQRVGIVKINSFTQETEQAVRRELKQLSSAREGEEQTETSNPLEAVSAIAIDLRGNVGGYMPAGVDVAKLFLPPRARIISEVDKTGRARIYINDGVGSETDTTTPLYVVVDEKTASASEILTAALQDNKRAVVVSGVDKTFGKGRIQNVQALSYGGSGIAVTKAKYTTPNGRDIQGVGITPDLRSKTCSPKDSAAACLESVL
eukprot:CAMPEP_0116129268 /NCGR_PEP_ID=MMETSP0329-20121206/7836_1 /TAXON_ID=697910 /ORGANISM="Pseudo-nitzschia arenysensis, Strain B593" /LENGTH=550 /DNA_ID=CAMNT_0003623529 /DNA_START=166 /DNA_END=1818 /DNA_ORIENTATION=+